LRYGNIPEDFVVPKAGVDRQESIMKALLRNYANGKCVETART
jgi:hypothetical protein